MKEKRIACVLWAAYEFIALENLFSGFQVKLDLAAMCSMHLTKCIWLYRDFVCMQRCVRVVELAFFVFTKCDHIAENVCATKKKKKQQNYNEPTNMKRRETAKWCEAYKKKDRFVQNSK